MRLLSGIRPMTALFLLFFSAVTVHGQGPVFGVYFDAGTIKYVPAHNGPNRPLEFRAWLSPGDRVVLQDNIAELILFDRDSSYLRIDGKGNYTVADLEKMPRRHVDDSLTLHYFSLLWNDAPHPAVHAAAAKQKTSPEPKSPIHNFAAVRPTSLVMLGPRHGYETSLDSVIFRWRNISWAQKYFLRIRNGAGELLLDSVLADTMAIVNFPGRMPFGNTYYWNLDVVGESGRLQFGDSSHIILIQESAVLPQLPSLPMDSLGGIAAVLRKIEQEEAAGCTRHADQVYHQLVDDFPADAALDRLYREFVMRNYLQ